MKAQEPCNVNALQPTIFVFLFVTTQDKLHHSVIHKMEELHMSQIGAEDLRDTETCRMVARMVYASIISFILWLYTGSKNRRQWKVQSF